MTLNRRAILALVSASAVTLVAPMAAAKSPPVYTEDTVAIDGTDTVAYFSEGKPVAGSRDHSVDWNGSTWLFANAGNAAAFAADPEKYAPQYGGYCAFAMANGYVAPTEPDAWSIVDGKLYLNFNLSVRSKWQTDIPGNIKKADAHWPAPLEN
ncbi:YHS domain-containing (seleno)protein [Neptunicoccus cionae]|uniref:YHS domain-containing (seleno)protein n=1 Tax=Neptunicoccus cionae TaxID=2035344 RepID=UPI000C78E1E8|nr:YHS domain-containing (seleno)protein [Amylibacter cionae]PLS20852.1 YHS domain protein [Amylibacter cionae]